MRQSIYGFDYDFERHGETVLLLSETGDGDNEDAMKIDEIAVKMLQSNRIEGLAAVKSEHWNGQSRWVYTIGYERTLSSAMKLFSKQSKDGFLWLRKLLITIEKAEAYLLHRNNIIVHEKFIFTDEANQHYSFIYVPGYTVHCKPQLQEELYGLIDRCLDGNKSNDRIINIMEYLKSPLFSLKQLKVLVDEVMVEYEERTVPINYDETNLYSSEQSLQQTVIEPKLFESTLPQFRNEITSANPETGKVEGLIRGMAAAVGRLLGAKPNRRTETLDETSEQIKMMLEDLNTADEKANHYYAQLHQHTTLLRSPDRTEILNPDMIEKLRVRTPRIHLDVKRGNEKETIHVTSDVFVIGRDKDAADYVEEASGTSRTHIEISRVEQQYGVKDLGSRNGSLLNDTPMVPNKFYPLHNGDRIQIIHVMYVVTISA